MRISSCLYGFVAHGAVFLFTGGCMLLAMAASLPFVFLLDRLPDVVFTAGAILTRYVHMLMSGFGRSDLHITRKCACLRFNWGPLCC